MNQYSRKNTNGPPVIKKTPTHIKCTRKRHVPLKKKKGKIFLFFYAVFSPKYNTVKQESLRPAGETK